MKKWCIIQFSSGDTELVPHTWVHGEKVFWPPYPSKETGKVRAAIRRRDMPCGGWQTYEPVRILISRDTYQEAKRCLHRYLKQECDTTDMESDTTDMESDAENKKKGRFKSTNKISAQDEFDQDNGQYQPPSKRPPASKVLFPASTTLQSPQTYGPASHNSQLISPSPNSTGDQTLHSPLLTEDFPAMTHVVQTPALRHGPTLFQGLSPEDVVLQKLLAMVSELSSEVKELRKEVQQFRQSCRCCQPEGLVGQQMSLADLVKMPIRNMGEFDHAEATLQAPEACNAMVARLTIVGGNSLDSRVRRIMRLVLTNEVASGLNWAGRKLKDKQKQKRAFKDTRLSKCIFDALTQQLGAGMTEYAFAQSVQKWLRYAPDRAGGVRRGTD